MEDRQRQAAIELVELTEAEVSSIELPGLEIDPLGLVGPQGEIAPWPGTNKKSS